MNTFLKSILYVSIFALNSAIFAMNQDRQFTLEQESKNKSAQANREAADRAVALQLQKEQDIASQSIDQDLKSIEENAALVPDRCTILAKAIQAHYGKKKLSDKELQQIEDIAEKQDICELIGTQYLHPKKLKFLAHNMESLLPAVLNWSKPTQEQNVWIDQRNYFVHYLADPHEFYIFKQIAKSKQRMTLHRVEADAEKVNATTPVITMVRPGIFLSSVKYMPISELSLATGDLWEFTQNENGFYGCCFPSGKIIFKVCPKKFKLLEKLEMRHLEFLVSLYQQYQDTLSQLLALNDGTTMVRIDLDEAQQKMYRELPQEIQTCLDVNYGYLHELNTPVTTMPAQMIVHSSLARLQQNTMVGTNAVIAVMGTQNTIVGRNALVDARINQMDAQLQGQANLATPQHAELQQVIANVRRAQNRQKTPQESDYGKWAKRLGFTTTVAGLGFALFHYFKK